MRPVMLKGHERSIVFVKYNKEGDLLFSCSKDNVPTAWYADDGARLGTFDGHRGTVWNCDVTDDSQFLITASADQSAKLWRVGDGSLLRTFNQTGPARWAAFSEGCREFLVARDNFKEHACAVCLYKLDLDAASKDWPSADEAEEEPYLTIHVHENPRLRITAALWMPLNTHLLVALENGTLKVFDTETGSCSREVDAHPGHNITSLVFSEDKTTFLTTSDDETAKLWDTKTLTVVKVYKCNTTVRSAALHPDRELILMGGGQEARDVTTSAAGAGKFETRIVHAVHCNELGKVQGHFGPLNTCAWNPNGTSFITGGEDGYVRLHNMKEDWGVWEHFGEEPELTDPAVLQAVKDGLDLLEDEAEAGAAAGGQ